MFKVLLQQIIRFGEGRLVGLSWTELQMQHQRADRSSPNPLDKTSQESQNCPKSLNYTNCLFRTKCLYCLWICKVMHGIVCSLYFYNFYNQTYDTESCDIKNCNTPRCDILYCVTCNKLFHLSSFSLGRCQCLVLVQLR